VELGSDDRTLTLRSIHSPPNWSDADAWFSGGRADVWYEDEAIRVLLWLRRCGPTDAGAARTNDPAREVEIVLDEPVAGRVVIDGVHGLVAHEGPLARRSVAKRWSRAYPWDPERVVVYWFGGASMPLDRIEIEYGDDALTLTLFEQSGGRLAGVYKATIVHLAEPLGAREIRDGAPPE
jgi:hypothetical protein